MPIIDQLVEAGPHALHSLDPQGGVDIAEVKAPLRQAGVPDRQRQLRRAGHRHRPTGDRVGAIRPRHGKPVEPG